MMKVKVFSSSRYGETAGDVLTEEIEKWQNSVSPPYEILEVRPAIAMIDYCGSTATSLITILYQEGKRI